MKFETKLIKNAVSTLIRNTKGVEVYIRQNGVNAILTASSMGIAGIAKVECSGNGTEEFGMNAKFLNDILASIDAEDVMMEKGTDGLVTIRGGRSRWTLKELSTEPMPYKKVSEPRLELTFSEERYKALMSRVVPFLDTGENTPALTGMTMLADGNVLRLYGANRHCISSQEIVLSETVPEKVRAVISREGCTLTLDDDVKWRLGEQALEVVSGNFAYQVRLIGAVPPDFVKATKAPDGMKVISVVKATFSDAVERVGLCARVVEASPLQVTINNDNIRLYAKSEMIGDAEENVSLLTKSGLNGEEFGMNSKYLENAVKAARSIKLKIGYTAPLSPIHISDDVEDNDKWKVVIAPVRIRNQE